MTANDLTIYSEYANEWWTPGAPRFRSLQNLTPFRLSLINEFVGDLNGKEVADLGCGGGLISIPLLGLGANVFGIDQSAKSIDVCKVVSNGRGNFVVGDICKIPAADNFFDVVIMADVLDHIPHFVLPIREAARILKPGGRLFLCTINRTYLAWFFSIFLGEGLRLIPPGTHDFKLFLKPEEIINAAKEQKLILEKLQGEWPSVLPTILKRAITLRRSNSCEVAYSVSFIKR